mgnify:CR=1 FL=1
MSEIKVRCVCCRKALGAADFVWQVRVVNCNGKTEYLPVCSEEHARLTQEKYSRIHAEMSKYTKQQTFKKMRVSDYLG